MPTSSGAGVRGRLARLNRWCSRRQTSLEPPSAPSQDTQLLQLQSGRRREEHQTDGIGRGSDAVTKRVLEEGVKREAGGKVVKIQEAGWEVVASTNA